MCCGFPKDGVLLEMLSYIEVINTYNLWGSGNVVIICVQGEILQLEVHLENAHVPLSVGYYSETCTPVERK